MTIPDSMRAVGWTDHKGGRNPVKSHDRVSLMFRDGCIRTGGGRGYRANSVPWEHGAIGPKYPELHIIAYRLERKP